jgi:RNA polymerase sigma-70 factor (ECF subfamily)
MRLTGDASHMPSHVTAPPGNSAAGDDAAMVLAARDDPAAFETLYEGYLDAIYAYLRARTATEEDAADLTQQVFLRALAALPQYHKHRGSFGAWLFRIARNAAIDHYRRQRETLTWHLVPERLHPHTEDDLAVGLARQEALAHVHALVGTLKPETREILALHYTARLTVAEVAAVVGKSQAAIKKQLSRTIHLLKDRYSDDP